MILHKYAKFYLNENCEKINSEKTSKSHPINDKW